MATRSVTKTIESISDKVDSTLSPTYDYVANEIEECKLELNAMSDLLDDMLTNNTDTLHLTLDERIERKRFLNKLKK